MDLYLSSFRLGEYPDRLAELAEGKGPVAFISNALDYFTDLKKKDLVVERGIDDLKNIGFESHKIDLRHYFEASDKLQEVLAEYRFVFVTGGNSFVLRRALAKSGMDSYLQKMLNEEDFLYAGYSAGACVVGPTMKGLHLVDDCEVLPEGYSREVTWDGLRLIEYNIAPHYRSHHFESDSMNKVVDFWIESKILFRALKDGEVIVHDSISQPVAGGNPTRWCSFTP